MSDVWIDFLTGQGFDHRGRTIESLWESGNRRLEASHDYIQWLFPLREPSPYNPDAPLLTDERAAAVRASPDLRARLWTSLARMLRFYGFTLRQTEDGPLVEHDEDTFDERSIEWVTPSNHNFLRITRILRCLTEVGMEAEARAFLAALSLPIEWYPGVISERTQQFWEAAVVR